MAHRLAYDPNVAIRRVRFPLLDQVSGYSSRETGRDLLAGVVLAAVLVPTGMGYAVAAGLPPINGLYATIVPLLVYALIGPSRILVFGPDSSLSPLLAGAVIPLAAGDPGRAVAVGMVVSLIAGALCVFGAIGRFGFLADLLSKPVQYGYLNGIALTVLATQLPRALGLRTGADSLIGAARDLLDSAERGGVNAWSAGIAAGTIAIIASLRIINRRIPGALLAMVGAVLLVRFGDLSRHGVALVGALPSGLPLPRWPGVPWKDLAEIVPVAVGVAFVSFADTSVLSRTYASKTGQRVDANRELFALGAVNLASGFLQGFPVSSSQSRTPVAEEAGSRSQLTGIVGAVLVVLLVVAAPGTFRYLPSAALSGVVIIAALRLVQLGGVLRLKRVRRSEFLLSLAAFAAVVLLGPIKGIGVAIGLSMLNFMRKVWRPYATELVLVDGLSGYHDATRHPEGARVPGLLLYRFGAPLFFANGGFIETDVLRRIDDHGASPGMGIRWVAVVGDAITDVDSSAAEALGELLDRLDERGIVLVFAGLKGTVRDHLEPYGLVGRVGRHHFYPTTEEAVLAYLQATGAEWGLGKGEPPGTSATPES